MLNVSRDSAFEVKNAVFEERKGDRFVIRHVLRPRSFVKKPRRINGMAVEVVPRAGIEPLQKYLILLILRSRLRIKSGNNVIQNVIQSFAAFSSGIIPRNTHGRSDKRRHPERFCPQVIFPAFTPPTPPFEVISAPRFQISARKIAAVSGNRFRLAAIRSRQRGPRERAS